MNMNSTNMAFVNVSISSIEQDIYIYIYIYIIRFNFISILFRAAILYMVNHCNTTDKELFLNYCASLFLCEADSYFLNLIDYP